MIVVKNTHTILLLISSMSSWDVNKMRFSSCHVVCAHDECIYSSWEFLHAHFFPARTSVRSKSGANCCSGLELLLGQKMSVQPFPQLLSTRTHTHTHAYAHPSFFSVSTVCSLGEWSYPGVLVHASGHSVHTDIDRSLHA